MSGCAEVAVLTGAEVAAAIVGSARTDVTLAPTTCVLDTGVDDRPPNVVDEAEAPAVVAKDVVTGATFSAATGRLEETVEVAAAAGVATFFTIAVGAAAAAAAVVVVVVQASLVVETETAAAVVVVVVEEEEVVVTGGTTGAAEALADLPLCSVSFWSERSSSVTQAAGM